MPWRALTLRVDRAAAEAFSDALLEAGAQSVALDVDGAMVAVVALEQEVHSLVAAAARAAGIAAPDFSTGEIADQDWVRATQAQFDPVVIGERLWIGPSWHRPAPDRLAVSIDPGLAFGTGTHPTTKLVLAYLDRTVRGGERVLDYGCGSGILAIAAAKLGAARVAAVDLDPEAVAIAAANARANRVVLHAALPEALPTRSYDIVVSNILAEPLILLAPALAARAAPGGHIALSGILESQAAEVMAAYAPWFSMQSALSEDSWALLEGRRK